MNKHFWASVSAALIWAFMVVPLHQLSHYSSFSILICRVLLTTILMFVYIALFNRKALQKDIALFRNRTVGTPQKVLILLVASGLCLAINWFSYIYLISQIDIKSGSLVYVICPLLLAIGSFIVYHDELDKYKVVSLVVAAIAVVYLSLSHLHTILLVLVCSLAYAIFMLIQKSLPQFNRLNLFAFETILIFLIAIPLFMIQVQNNAIHFESYFWVRLVIIAVCFTILPMILNLYALHKVPASTVAIIIYLNPIASFLLGVIIYGEQLLPQETLVYSSLLLSVLIFNFPRIKEAFHKRS